MPDQKISELTTIVTVDNAVDLFPIVDTSANTTKKITPTALKSALALDNVNNTSDANKPVSTAQQDALNAKVTANAAITGATKTKITYDAKGLITAGDILDASDMPTGINAANIGTGVVSSTEFGYLDGVTSAIQTQLNAKQATLVSGTNIKTINSTSLLGSGDITISANPSGVSGAIQFSNGSAFASDAANLFWDDTNNRLGVGTNAPTAITHIKGVDQLSTSTSLLVQDSVGTNILRVHNSANNSAVVMSTAKIADYDITSLNVLSNTQMRFVPTTGGLAVNKDYSFAASNTLVHLKGSGSTSATTSLLVQNSAGTQTFKVDDGGNVTIGSANGGVTFNAGYNNAFFQNALSFYSTGTNIRGINAGGQGLIISKNSGTTDLYPTALLAIDSTTQGFLPPRMTTTQKNAIASPAAGLVVMDITTNKLCCYNGSTWNDLF